MFFSILHFIFYTGNNIQSTTVAGNNHCTKWPKLYIWQISMHVCTITCIGIILCKGFGSFHAVIVTGPYAILVTGRSALIVTVRCAIIITLRCAINVSSYATSFFFQPLNMRSCPVTVYKYMKTNHFTRKLQIMKFWKENDILTY